MSRSDCWKGLIFLNFVSQPAYRVDNNELIQFLEKARLFVGQKAPINSEPTMNFNYKLG